MKPISLFANQVIHGDCIQIMRSMPDECVDFVLTDPPYLANHVSRDGRTIANDGSGGGSWLRPAFTEIFRLLKPDHFCVSFYGWHQAERFVWTWKKIGFYPVGHLTCVKDYSSKDGFTKACHENAYLLAKGKPAEPQNPIRDVLHWRYTGNRLHPTQKPVEICRQIIEAFSAVAELVLDPFAGSGTTGIAARECGRRFILVETVWRYFRIAQDRLTTKAKE